MDSINIWLIYPKRAYENPNENEPTCLRHLVVPEEEWLHGRTERVDSPLAKDGDRNDDQASEDNRPHCKGDTNCNKYEIFFVKAGDVATCFISSRDSSLIISK